MEAAGIAFIGFGIFFMWCSFNDVDPLATIKKSLNTGVPTVVKIGG